MARLFPRLWLCVAFPSLEEHRLWESDNNHVLPRKEQLTVVVPMFSLRTRWPHTTMDSLG